MPLDIGTRLGPYEVTAQIGAGGMGEVYEARDTRLGREVAVKVLPEHLKGDSTQRRRFEREAKTVSRLSHPHICPLFDIGSEAGVDFLVMEHLEGETLEERLRKGPLPMAEVLEVGAQIAGAIAAAHRQGVVHRDLKPGNLMLTEHGVKVLDFGLAKAIEAPLAAFDTVAATRSAPISLEGSISGTVPYMAPEQLEGKPADAKTDIWALGCVIYEMVSGRRPFQGETQASLIGRIMETQPLPLSRHGPLSPPQLDEIVTRCLEKDRARRPRSATEVSEALAAIAAEGEPPNVTAPPTRARRKISTGAIGGATLVVTLVAFTLLLWWLGSRSLSVDAEAPVGMDAEKLAVLPFENQSGDPSLDALALGLSEEVVASFTNIWPVVSHTTSFAYRGTPICEAAAQMGVRFVIEGSVRKVGDHRVRFTVHATSCPDEDRIWTADWERELGDPVSLQDEIAYSIRTAAVARLWDRVARDDNDWAALHAGTPRDNVRAIAEAHDLWEREKTDIRVLAQIPYGHMQALAQNWVQTDKRRKRSLTEMGVWAQKCLALEPDNYVCHDLVAFHAMMTSDADLMIRHLEKAVELNPTWLQMSLLGRTLALASRPDEATSRLQELLDRAESGADIEISNIAAFRAAVSVGMANAAFATGSYQEAVDWARQGLDTGYNDQANIRAELYQVLAASLSHLDQVDLARDALAEAAELRPKQTLAWVDLRYSTSASEHRERYREGLRQAGLVE